MKLKPYQEIVGTLSEVRTEENQVKLVFTVRKEVGIPMEAISKDELHAYIGQLIGLYNNDGDYKIREVKTKEERNQNLKKFLELHPGINPNKAEFFYVALREIREMQDERNKNE